MAMATSEIEQVTTLIERSTQEINARWSRANTRMYTKIEELEQTVESLTQANNNRHLEIRLVGIIAIVGFVTGLAGVLTLALN